MKNFVSKLLLSLVIGAITGAIMGIYNIDKSLIIPITLAIVFIIFVPGIFKSWMRPVQLINSGKIDEAIEVYTKVHNNYKSRPLYKNQALLNLANLYHLKGEFTKSEELLNEGWGKFDKFALAVAYGIHGANLLIEGELEKAEECADKSFAIIPATDYYLSKAYLKLLQGKEREADSWFEKYQESGNKRFTKIGIHSIFIKVSPIEDIIKNYSLGQYYFKKGEFELAKKYFTLASNNKFDIYYSKQAKENLRTLE